MIAGVGADWDRGAIGIGAQFFEEKHEQTIAVMAGDGGGDFLTLAIDFANLFGALHGATAHFDFGGVGGLVEGGIPLLGKGTPTIYQRVKMAILFSRVFEGSGGKL
jgi:hypothetical protein